LPGTSARDIFRAKIEEAQVFHTLSQRSVRSRSASATWQHASLTPVGQQGRHPRKHEYWESPAPSSAWEWLLSWHGISPGIYTWLPRRGRHSKFFFCQP